MLFLSLCHSNLSVQASQEQSQEKEERVANLIPQLRQTEEGPLYRFAKCIHVKILGLFTRHT